MSDPGIAPAPTTPPTTPTPAASPIAPAPVPAPASAPPTFQYNFLELTSDTSNEEVTAQLNELGADGWKIVAASATEEFYTVYLMKEC